MRALAIFTVALGMFACAPAFEEGDACGNGFDDDDDGLVDCDDPDCALTIFCGLCGNGKIDPGEACDDGNIVDGDGCSSRCTSELCGNGHVDPGEQCDDGNLIAGDGCNALCLIDHCGDFRIDEGEQCDDASLLCVQCHATPPTGCGDGQIDFSEQCDDGNNQSGDGCSATCQFEFCGDGVVQPNAPLFEKCDDAAPNAPPGCRGCQLAVP